MDINEKMEKIPEGFFIAKDEGTDLGRWFGGKITTNKEQPVVVYWRDTTYDKILDKILNYEE